MFTYRCVPAPMNFVIRKPADMDNAVASFANIINREASQGWEFYSMEQIATTVPAGCLASLFGSKDVTTYHNMLIFRRLV